MSGFDSDETQWIPRGTSQPQPGSARPGGAGSAGGPAGGADHYDDDLTEVIPGGSGGALVLDGDDGAPGDRDTRWRGPRHAAPDPWADRVRTGMRGVGQTLITSGLVILLFVVYELWVTDIFNARTQHRLHHQLAQEWSQGKDPLAVGPARPGEKIRNIPLGDGIANIRIPAFGADWGFTIVEGTGDAQLTEGPGHYTNSVYPGEVGDFAVAGHRVGKGSPFNDLDKLEAGDTIVIETRSYWYTYKVLGDQNSGDTSTGDVDGIPGREIVLPSDIGVIAPVPDHPGRTANRRLITLTTCHPKFSAAQRLVIHGEMVGAPLKKGPGVVPPALRG